MRAWLMVCSFYSRSHKAADPHPGPLPAGEGVNTGFSHASLLQHSYFSIPTSI